MAFDINTNVASLQAQNYLQTTNNFQNQTINEVTSGLRIIILKDTVVSMHRPIAQDFKTSRLQE